MEKFAFMSRTNLEYIEDMFTRFRQQPDSLPPEWRMFFEGVEFAQNLNSSTGEGFSGKELDVYNLIETYRSYGHLKAKLDPLEMNQRQALVLELAHFNLSEKDLDQNFHIGSTLGLGQTTLRNIISHLEKCYCQTLTAQLAECRPEVRDWFRKEFESSTPALTLDNEEKGEIYRQLARTESLEKFLHTR
ncbi:MAG: 2-oxoglutarate dehydrogenase subunit E1, partial [Bdellovibrionales bacterium]